MAKLISADLTNNKLCILEYTTTDGQMLSFKEDAFDAKIVSHTYTNIGKVIFDKPITKIGDSAFSGCTSLKSITIPESVTEIASTAFSDCTSLECVTVLSRTRFREEEHSWFGKGLFIGCTLLKTINVPSCVDYYKEMLPEELHDKIVELE